jgi:glycosyltransferase involved in cell wall biosynthesis
MTAGRLRATLLSSEYPPHVLGGLGVHVERLTGELAAAVDFDLYAPAEGDYLTANPAVRVHEVPAASARTDVENWLFFCRTAARLAEASTRTADLVHCHDWMTVLAGVRLRQVTGRPLVYNVHLPQEKGLRGTLENLGLLAADVVLVNSRAVRSELLARGLPVRRIEVVPNGVDLQTFRPAADWPRDGGYVLFVGRLVTQKGVEVLLRAFDAVLRRCPESRLVIAGEGDLELYLERVACHLGFPDRVRMVGWQTGAALVELYQRAQVVVVPSLYEPFGIVALEAMACGRPVVASRVGGLAEVLEDTVEGYLVPRGDHLELASRLAGLLLDPQLRERMGEAARRRAASFGWERTAQETLALYQGLAGQITGPLPGEAAAACKEELLAAVGGTVGGAIEELLDFAELEPVYRTAGGIP